MFFVSSELQLSKHLDIIYQKCILDYKSSKSRHILSTRPRLEQPAQVVWFPPAPLGNQPRFTARCLLIFGPAAYKYCEHCYDDGDYGYCA